MPLLADMDEGDTRTQWMQGVPAPSHDVTPLCQAHHHPSVVMWGLQQPLLPIQLLWQVEKHQHSS